MVMAPPCTLGSLAITPTGMPFSRASAVMTEPPCQRPISNTESRSMMLARILRGS
jgi:hypothetical protein